MPVAVPKGGAMGGGIGGIGCTAAESDGVGGRRGSVLVRTPKAKS